LNIKKLWFLLLWEFWDYLISTMFCHQQREVQEIILPVWFA